MKKEIEQAEKRVKDKKFLEKQVASHKKTIEEHEAAISKLQSDLKKLSELRSKEKEDHETELAATRKSVKNAEEYCAGRFASFSEMLSSKIFLLTSYFWLVALFSLMFFCLSVYSTNPEAEQAHMAKYAELMKKANYTLKTMEFAL